MLSRIPNGIQMTFACATFLSMTKDTQVSIRLDAATADRAGSLVGVLAALPEYGAVRLTRATVLRMALLEGLAALESRHTRRRR